MLRHMAYTCAIALFVACGTCAFAQSPGGNQFGQPGVSRPTTSPYLNLLQGRNNRSVALDYFRLVKPEQEWRRYTSGLNQRLNLVESTLSQDLLPDGSRGTVKRSGHSTTFMNTGSYFPQKR